MTGIFEFEIKSGKVGFKFGTYAISEACEKDGCSVDVLLKRCGVPYLEKGEARADKPKLKSILNLFWGAAIHYAEDNNLSTNFKTSTVANWLDEIGIDNLQEMLSKGLSQYTPKNSNSLKENRETVTQ